MHRWKEFQNFDRDYPSTDIHISMASKWKEPEPVGGEFDAETDMLAKLLAKKNNPNAASSGNAKVEAKSSAGPSVKSVRLFVCLFVCLFFLSFPLACFWTRLFCVCISISLENILLMS
jgi:hypothetical protein